MSAPGSALLIATLVVAAGFAVFSGAKAEGRTRSPAPVLGERCIADSGQTTDLASIRQHPCHP
jgi:hypothetical protein